MCALLILTCLMTAFLYAVLGIGLITSAHAGDREVIQCRATEDARQRAGLCGAHGCDCGLLKSECAASLKYLNSFDYEGRQGAGYMREAYAYEHACRGQ